MTDQTSQQDREAFEKCAVENGMHDLTYLGDGADKTYLRDPIHICWNVWQAALKHAQQAVVSERDKALEEAARACEQKYTGLGGPPDDPHPDAILHNGCVHDCARAIRALKSRQPAQADKDQP